MKVALTIWNHRISPVFDTARNLTVITLENGTEIERASYEIAELDYFNRADRLQALHVDVLICGAISRPLENEIIARGIDVIAHVCGFMDDIFQAYCTNQLSQDRFLMPGCCGRRRFRCRHQGPGWKQKGISK